MQTAVIDRSKAWTVADYLQLEEGVLAQLVNGELIMSPAPSPLHQRVVRELYNQLSEAHLPGELFFAPIDLFLDGSNVFQPDLLFLDAGQAHFVTPRGIEGAPALVVEVISPSNSFLDRNLKKQVYIEAGVREYWIVDPGNHTLEICFSGSGQPVRYFAESDLVTSGLFPYLSFPLADLFQ